MYYFTQHPLSDYPKHPERRHTESLEPNLHSYAEIDVDAIVTGSESPLWTFEAQLGHYVKSGEITAEEAVQALNDYEAWLNAGQPKLSTLPGPYIFD